jgi:hypothetical protein
MRRPPKLSGTQASNVVPSLGALSISLHASGGELRGRAESHVWQTTAKPSPHTLHSAANSLGPSHSCAMGGLKRDGRTALKSSATVCNGWVKPRYAVQMSFVSANRSNRSIAALRSSAMVGPGGRGGNVA